MQEIFIPAIFASLATFFITPLTIYIAKKYKLVDDPKFRKHPAQTHKGIVPRAGGLALFTGFALALVLFLPFDSKVQGILIAAFLTVIIGLFDDRKDVSPYLRFLGNILTAAIVVIAGVGIPYITNPFGGVFQLNLLSFQANIFGIHTFFIIADILAIIWIVWTMNIVGWSSGIDGQMPGFIAITAAILGIQSLRFLPTDPSQLLVTQLAFITMGTFIGFIPWNFFPQKIMPGYGGKTLAGLLIATLSILSVAKVGSAILLLAIPMIDAVFLLTRRLVSKKSPFRADRNHLHHYLLDIGWSKRKIALFYWSVSLILGILTLYLNSRQKLFALLMVTVFVGAIIFTASQIVSKDPNES